MSKGQLIVLSGPSGVGKSTIVKYVTEMHPKLRFSVSATTREMRPGEVDGVNYYFVDHAKFEQMIACGELLEYVQYVGNYYGTPSAPVKENLAAGINMLLDIEVIGASNVRKAMPDAVTIFLAPPSMEALEKRLRGRGDVSEEKIVERLNRAKEEYKEIPKYDYIVINDDVDEAAKELQAIILAEQCRTENRIRRIK